MASLSRDRSAFSTEVYTPGVFDKTVCFAVWIIHRILPGPC